MDKILKWYDNAGENVDVVISSGALISRNLADYPFPCRLSAEGVRLVDVSVWNTVKGFDDPRFNCVNLGVLQPYEVVSLAERRLISPLFASAPGQRLLLVTPDEALSMMLCEQDHIRIRALAAGMALDKVYAAASGIESALGDRLDFAFDDRLGYLTQDPSQLGTGLSVFVLMHLPALTYAGKTGRFAAAADKLGISVRGLSGAGRDQTGDIYVVTNRITMGLSEEEAVGNLGQIVMQLATQERSESEQMVGDAAAQDRIDRAMGLLKSARLLTAAEMTELLSWLRLGARVGMNSIPIPAIDRLIMTLQPAGVSAAAGIKLSSAERDRRRADAVRAVLAGLPAAGDME